MKATQDVHWKSKAAFLQLLIYWTIDCSQCKFLKIILNCKSLLISYFQYKWAPLNVFGVILAILFGKRVRYIKKVKNHWFRLWLYRWQFMVFILFSRCINLYDYFFIVLELHWCVDVTHNNWVLQLWLNNWVSCKKIETCAVKNWEICVCLPFDCCKMMKIIVSWLQWITKL